VCVCVFVVACVKLAMNNTHSYRYQTIQTQLGRQVGKLKRKLEQQDSKSKQALGRLLLFHAAVIAVIESV